jgi:hypothetical protein
MNQVTNDQHETGAELAPGGEPASPRPAKRPGCVTAYALLLGIVAALVGGAVVSSVLVAIVTGDTAGMPVGGLAILLALAGVEFLIAVGVWRLRNWARIAVIVVQSLAIVTSLLGLVATLEGGDVALSLGGTLIGVGVSGYIIYWFASHGEYFD